MLTTKLNLYWWYDKIGTASPPAATVTMTACHRHRYRCLTCATLEYDRTMWTVTVGTLGQEAAVVSIRHSGTLRIKKARRFRGEKSKFLSKTSIE